MTIAAEGTTLQTTGRVLHWAFRYDLLVWLVAFGREGSFREKTLGCARLKPGESVLDVGCGTGTLAIAAKQRVGIAGSVQGIDASPEMIARKQESLVQISPSRTRSPKPCRFPANNSTWCWLR